MHKATEEFEEKLLSAEEDGYYPVNVIVAKSLLPDIGGLPEFYVSEEEFIRIVKLEGLVATFRIYNTLYRHYTYRALFSNFIILYELPAGTTREEDAER